MDWTEKKVSCSVLSDPLWPTDCSPPGSSVPGILEWRAIPFSSGSSWPGNQTWVSYIAGGFFTIWGTRDWIASPATFVRWGPRPPPSLFRQGFCEAVTGNGGHQDRVLVARIGVFIRRHQVLLSSTTRGHSGKEAVHKPGREPSLEPSHAGTWSSDFQPPELCKNKFLLLKPPSVWYLIMAAQAD